MTAGKNDQEGKQVSQVAAIAAIAAIGLENGKWKMEKGKRKKPTFWKQVQQSLFVYLLICICYSSPQKFF